MLTRYALCSQENQSWIDLENPTDAEIQELGKEFDIDPLYLQDVLQPEHLPKWEFDDDANQYFLIGRYADPEAKRSSDTIHTLTRKIAVFATAERIITIHRGQVPFLDELREKVKDPNSRYRTPFHLLCKILKEVFRTFEHLAVEGSNELEFYESKILQNAPLPPFLRGLFQLRRRGAVIRKLLLLSKTLLDALRDMEDNRAQVQDTRDMYLRVETLGEELYEHASSLMSMHLALSDLRANQVMKVLTVFAAFFLPNTFIAGIYGMNFDNMPELHTKYGYFFALAGMAIISAGIYAWFNKKGWI